MRLSVLSALARMDVDPWEEATRLAAMPKAIAERTLVSTLDLVPGRSWDPSEAGNSCTISSASSTAERRCKNCVSEDRKSRRATD